MLGSTSPVSPSTQRGRLIAQIALAAAVIAHIASVVAALVAHDGTAIAKSWFADDAFYYLEPANRIVAGQGSTFDGSALTNGYHPLWMLCCCAIAAFTPRAAQIETVYALQGLMMLASAMCIWRALARLHATAAALASALLLAAVGARSTLMNGMESGLGMLLLSALLAFTLTRGGEGLVLTDRRRAVSAWLLLAALSLCRLEMALVSAMWLMASLWATRGHPDGAACRRRVLAVFGALATTAVSYLLINLWIADWPVPISGSLKWGLKEDPATMRNTLLTHGLAFVAAWRPLLSWMSAAFVIGIGGILLAALVAMLAAQRVFQLRLAPVVVGCLSFVAVVTQRSGGFSWYAWPALFLGTVATFAVFDRLAALGERLPRVAALLPVAALLVGTYSAVAPVARQFRPRPDILFDWTAPEALWDHCVRFLRERVPPDDVVAGTAVGHVAFTTGRSIVQAEGLVNDRRYLQAIRDGDPAGELRRRGVTWVFGPVKSRAALPDVLARYWRSEDVIAVTWLTDAYGLSLGAPDDVAFVQLRANR